MVTIRPLSEADAAAYRDLRLTALRKSPDAYGWTAGEVEHSTDFVKECAFTPEHFVLGAFADEQLVGITAFRRQTRLKLRHRGDIMQVYVHPDHAGQGVASRLMEEAITRAFELPGLQFVELGVRPTNEPAVKLYEKLGFRLVTFWPEYFRLGDQTWDQQFMRLTREVRFSK